MLELPKRKDFEGESEVPGFVANTDACRGERTFDGKVAVRDFCSFSFSLLKKISASCRDFRRLERLLISITSILLLSQLGSHVHHHCASSYVLSHQRPHTSHPQTKNKILLPVRQQEPALANLTPLSSLPPPSSSETLDHNDDSGHTSSAPNHPSPSPKPNFSNHTSFAAPAFSKKAKSPPPPGPLPNSARWRCCARLGPVHPFDIYPVAVPMPSPSASRKL